MKISTFVDIESTPEVVFGWLARPERAMEWMSSVSRTEILQQTPGMVGTTFREVVEEQGGSMEMHGTVTGFEAPRSISFHLSSTVNVLDVSYRVEPTASGVRVVEDSDIRWKFPVNVMSIFIGGKMKQGILAQLQAEFSKLKALCEAESIQAMA
jgi:hypothetical protein